MIPDPSKRPFTHPLGIEALQYFCHPRHEVFRRPVRRVGGVWAANGYAAIRVTRGIITFDDTIPEAYPQFGEQMARLPWHLVEGGAEEAPEFRKMDGTPDLRGRDSAWRKIDDSRGTIYRGDLLPLWENGQMTSRTPVMVAGSTMVPLAMLQLLARLPRAEVRMSTGDFLAIRFTGGEAIIPGRWRHSTSPPAPRFRLFTTAAERSPGP